MEAKELMISDLVLLDGEPKRLRLRDIFEISRGIYDADPIPLTEEILEKNGFEFVEDSKISISSTSMIDEQTSISFQYHNSNVCFFQIYYCGPGSYEIRKYIRYVHELQHALRLCRLNYLADDFKV